MGEGGTQFKNKQVLVMGLGILGGGVATTKWFVKHGARVTVTDLRKRRELAGSICALGAAAKKVKFALGRHRASDFKTNDLIVVNPAVPRESKFLEIARRAGKDVTNDAKIFFDLVRNPVVAVTGTRGKTTTTNWIAHLVGGTFRGTAAAGNTPEMPLLALIEKLKKGEGPAVVELSSWQLELMGKAARGPDIAIITNLYPDHLNRYRGMRDYARAKANIFARQTASQHLVLNAESPWTGFFLARRPRSQIRFFSTKPLPKKRNGICLRGGTVYLTNGKKRVKVLSRRTLARFAHKGAHNLENLLAATLAAHLARIPWPVIRARLTSLPAIPFREETIARTKRLTAINDTAATSPEATIAALTRFADRNLILIAGGTDKKLEFGGWANTAKRFVKPEHLFLLEGSATEKMVRALRRVGYFRMGNRAAYPQLFGTLPSLTRAAWRKAKEYPHATVLFSPGAASFEKFKNEFDRGRKFNRYWKQISP